MRARGTIMLSGAVMATLLVSGCAPGAGTEDPRTSSEAIADNVESAGFENVEVSVRESRNGFQRNVTATIRVSIPDTVKVRDPGAVLEYLMRSVWAAQGEEPTRSITVHFVELGDVDWQTAGRAAGLPLSQTTDPDRPRMAADDATRAFGPWPGEVPRIPRGALGPR